MGFLSPFANFHWILHFTIYAKYDNPHCQLN